MKTPDHSEAWNTFWHRQQKRSGAGGGCLPQGWRGIAERQRKVWQSFAKSLPKSANVLDLATGDGAVLVHLQQARPDLHLTGVDLATALPTDPKGITLRGGIGMEDLPFSNDAFDAVTSQFGFEYGNIGKVAAEAARVLKPAGKLAILTHRASGPIVAHNRKRREQILWAVDSQKLTDAARTYLAVRDTGSNTLPTTISDAPAAGASAHGERSAAWEIAEAIRQTLEMGKSDSAANVAKIIGEIEAQAQNELARIASLEAAAATASDEDAFFETLEAAGFAFAGEAMVSDGQYPSPFADYRTFTLRS